MKNHDLTPTEITDDYLRSLDDRQLQRVWENVPSVREEFMSMEVFLAYCSALKRGQIRVLSGRAVTVSRSSDAEGLEKRYLAN